MVLELPPAPAARVLVGRALATLSCRSAAARLRIIVLGPPGGVGEEGRTPVALPELGPGELGGGDDCSRHLAPVHPCLRAFQSCPGCAHDTRLLLRTLEDGQGGLRTMVAKERAA